MKIGTNRMGKMAWAVADTVSTIQQLNLLLLFYILSYFFIILNKYRSCLAENSCEREVYYHYRVQVKFLRETRREREREILA